MTDFGLTKENLEMIKGALRIFTQVEEAIIFGSRAMGHFEKASDIDIALKGNLDLSTVGKVKTLLEDGLPLLYFFDVVDYNSITNVKLKQHIDEYGKVFYKANLALN